MEIGYLTLCNGHAQIEIVSRDGGTVPDPTTTVFLAASEEEGVLLAVMNAVAEMHHFTKTEDPLSFGNFSQNPQDYYTYAYFRSPETPRWNECFYVGKGKGMRWTNHVAVQAAKNAPLPRTEKERLIKDWVQQEHTSTPAQVLELGELLSRAESRLVRKVGQWSGHYAEAQSFAAEYYLIRGWLGAYALANDTGGNARIGDVRVMTRDAGLHGHEPAHMRGWERAVKTFCQKPDDPNLASRLRPALLLLANQDSLSQVDDLMRPIGLFPHPVRNMLQKDFPEISAHVTVEGASDACLSFSTKDNRPFRFQLKLSMKEVRVRVNLRPRDNSKTAKNEFINYMRQMTTKFYGDIEPIKAMPGAPYFKPFSENAVGRTDVSFPLFDGDKSVQGRANWIKNKDFTLTLTEALKSFLQAFPIPK